MRVPLGLFLSWRITAALSSKRIYEPSGRPYSLAWRTMTALTTSPFLTEPPGVASLTEATMTSPIEASNLEPPATTRMHISSRAPVLSATRSRVCGMIMGASGAGCRVSGRRARRHLTPGAKRASCLDLCDLDRLARTAADDLLHRPVLASADRPRLGNDHGVANLAAIGFIVHLEAAGAAQGAPVQAMAGHHLDRNDDGLVHLVAGHAPDLGAARLAGWSGFSHGRRAPVAAAGSSPARCRGGQSGCEPCW